MGDIGQRVVTDHSIMGVLADSISNGRPVVLATVIRTSRSVPRRAGSKMLLWADGSEVGTDRRRRDRKPG